MNKNIQREDLKPIYNHVIRYQPFTVEMAGVEWLGELVTALYEGGGAIFPHTYISKCGGQMGAVIHAILDSGADQVILLGTHHPSQTYLRLVLRSLMAEISRKSLLWEL